MFSVHPKNGLTFPAKAAYLVNEYFDEEGKAQNEIDRLGLTDIMEVQCDDIEG